MNAAGQACRRRACWGFTARPAAAEVEQRAQTCAFPLHAQAAARPAHLCLCRGWDVSWQVKEGDRVIYFKYAGDAMETPSGEKYNVLHASDILAKL